MKFRTLLAALMLAVLPAAAFAGDVAKHNVVLQVSDNDPAKWNLALNNAENIQEALGKGNVRVEIVAYGPGLNMLKMESKVAPRLAQALDNSVDLLACGTTMKKMKITKDDLYSGVNVVPGGVVHIMQRQSEGWSYIRP